MRDVSQLFPIVIILVWFIGIFWRRSVTRRRRWLRRLNLPGNWSWQDGSSELSLSGEPSAGSFLLREGSAQCSGRWKLLGHSLELRQTRGDLSLGSKQPYVLDLRLFPNGTLGLDGAQRERRIYQRNNENVVPLRGNR